MKTKLALTTRTRNAGGRTRKFTEASRPITITLPDRVLHTLDALGPDRARAIVRAVDHLHPGHQPEQPPVELVEVAKDISIIVVGPSARLRKIPNLRLIEVAPSRYLLTLMSGLTTTELEITLADILEDDGLIHAYERKIIAELHKHLRHLRRAGLVTRAEMLFVAT